MNRSRLSHEARKLLEADLDSLEKLEVLRYLQHAPGVVSRTELVRALQLERDTANALIGELARADLVETGGAIGGVRLSLGAESPACEELLQLYDEDRLVIVSALSTLAMSRIRSMAMQTYGEALVSKKKPSDDSNEP